MINIFEKSCEVLNREIKAVLVYTDNGITATVAGGDKAHIGAVTIIDESGALTTNAFPTHKESLISEKWARVLFQKFNQPVVVSAGIHYDNISKENIGVVVRQCDELLKKSLIEFEKEA
ncbi:MAG: hypothetical protein J6P79_14630 [Pseudobutyrivibrio sp.]|nr:hypothetical protein [Pseudobutyrivibrio sp.]